MTKKPATTVKQKKGAQKGASSAVDLFKWSLTGLAVLATAYVAVYVKMATQVLHTAVVIAMLAVCFGISLWTQKGQELLRYGQSAWQEMHRVTWPSKQETKSVTLYVAIVVLVASIVMWLLDNLLTWLVSLVTG